MRARLLQAVVIHLRARADAYLHGAVHEVGIVTETDVAFDEADAGVGLNMQLQPRIRRRVLRGLLAGTQAEIDVRPQLEIYTDDVRCNHGATAGKLDDNMLFYLLSRGIEKETAQQLLKWVFLEDVVSRIAVPELRKHIEQTLAGQMKETAALKELL